MALIKSHIPWAIKIDNFPEQAISLTYNTESQSPTWNFFDTEKMYISGGTTSEINAGTYYTEFLPFRKFVFPNGTKKTYYAAWTIAKAQNILSLSETSGEVKIKFTRTFTISKLGDGEVTVTSSDPNIAEVSISGNKVTITGKKVGDVTITVNVAEGTNYLAASATYSCQSRKTQITVPVVSVASKPFTGYSISPTVYYAPSASLVERTGTFSAVNYSPSPYSFTYRILDTDAYEWADGTTAPKTFYWYITKRIFPQPVQVGTLRYNGTFQKPTWNFGSGFNPNLIEFSGNIDGWDPSTYRINFHLTDTVNCEWWDGSITDKTATWVILKMLIETPRMIDGNLVYNGYYQEPRYEYDRFYSSVSGTLGATNANIGENTHKIYFRIDQPKLAEFEGGQTTITLEWRMRPSEDQAYNLYGNTYIVSAEGEEHGLGIDFWIDTTEGVYVVASNRNHTSEFNVPGYPFKITLKLKNPDNMRWGDGSKEDKYEYWEHYRLS